MNVLKVGGGVLRTAADIERLPELLRKHDDTRILVVSALGKTTNALECVASDAWNGDMTSAGRNVDTIVRHHASLCRTLEMNNDVIMEIVGLGNEIRTAAVMSSKETSHEEFADRILSYGERISAYILSSYLFQTGVRVHRINTNDLMITNARFGAAEPLLPVVRQRVKEQAMPSLDTFDIVVLEGYVGATEDGRPTTLGREGSDYSAAIFAALVQAEELILYKDVPGVLSCDPKIDGDARVLPRLSYDEAERLFTSGAKVVHPNTIRPVRNAGIEIKIVPFEGPGSGTVIGVQPGWKDGRISSVCGKPIRSGLIQASEAGLQKSKHYSLISLLGGYPYTKETCDTVEQACRDERIVIIVENDVQKGWVGITEREMESETIRRLHRRLVLGTGEGTS